MLELLFILDVKKFAALFCGNMLAMLQMVKEENVPLLIVSYHELKVSITNGRVKNLKRLSK